MQPNKDYMINSLVNQIANLTMQVAERDAVIAELNQELEQLRKSQIDDMDGDENGIEQNSKSAK